MDKHIGELNGEFDLGDTELNYGTLGKPDNIAADTSAFLLHSIVNPF